MENLISGREKIISIVLTIGMGAILGNLISLIFPWGFFGGESIFLNSLLIVAVIIYYGKLSFIEVPKRSAGVLTFLGKRKNIFLDEGFWGLFVPGIFGVEPLDIKELTLGKEGEKYVEARCLSRDRVEMSVVWSAQLQITNPIKWFNTKDPMDAVNNKFLSELRIIIDLFVSSDFNQLKGVVSGIFKGKTYVVFRLPGGYLLKDRFGSIIAEEIKSKTKEEKTKAIQEVVKRAKTVEKPFEDADGNLFYPQKEVSEDTVEIIPPTTFRHEDLVEEAKRIGSQVESQAIKDITPPPKVMSAWEESEIERAQKKARERENEAHMSIALTLMGKKESDDRSSWKKEDWDRFQQLMAVVRAQEKNNENIVRIIGSGDLGDKAIAAASMFKGGKSKGGKK